MCIVIAKPSGENYPDKNTLRNCESSNRDGIGICYIKPHETMVTINKDFNDHEDLHEWLNHNIEKEDLAIIHFRYKTAGLKIKGNRHPFPITSNMMLLKSINLKTRYAMAHNGTFTKYSGHKKYSDTQKFTVDMLADPAIKNNLTNKKIQKLLTDYIGFNKIAILTHRHELITLGEFEEHEGLLYSNDGYKDSWNWSYGYDLLEFKSYSSIKNRVYSGICDGCNHQRTIKEVIIDDEAFNLCKKCRRKAKRNNRLVQKGEELIDCDYCANAVPERYIHDLWESKVCRECYLTYSGQGD